MKLPPKAAAAGAAPPKQNAQLSELADADREKAYREWCKNIVQELKTKFEIDVDGLEITVICAQLMGKLSVVDPKSLVRKLFPVIKNANKKWKELVAAGVTAPCVPKYVHPDNKLIGGKYAYPLVGALDDIFGKQAKNVVYCPWCFLRGSTEKLAECPLGSTGAQILHINDGVNLDDLKNTLIALLLVQAATWPESPLALAKMFRWFVYALKACGINLDELEPEQLALLADMDSDERSRQAKLKIVAMEAEMAAMAAEKAAMEAEMAAMAAEKAAMEAEKAAMAAERAAMARAAAGLQNRLTTEMGKNHRDKAKIEELQDRLGFTQSQLGFTQFQLNGAAAALGRSPEVRWKCPRCGMVNKGTFGYCPYCCSSFTVREMLP